MCLENKNIATVFSLIFVACVVSLFPNQGLAWPCEQDCAYLEHGSQEWGQCIREHCRCNEACDIFYPDDRPRYCYCLETLCGWHDACQGGSSGGSSSGSSSSGSSSGGGEPKSEAECLAEDCAGLREHTLAWRRCMVNCTQVPYECEREGDLISAVTGDCQPMCDPPIPKECYDCLWEATEGRKNCCFVSKDYWQECTDKWQSKLKACLESKPDGWCLPPEKVAELEQQCRIGLNDPYPPYTKEDRNPVCEYSHKNTEEDSD